MQSKNRLVVAAAGTGKTSLLVDQAILYKNEPTLITTYTLNGCEEIKKKFIQKRGYIPPWVTIMSWYQFLLRECVRPYQSILYPSRISSVFFPESPELFYGKHRYVSESKDFNKFYFVAQNKIIERNVSKFAVRCNEATQGLVTTRLAMLYKHILIDEIQDLAGWDLSLIEQILSSTSETILVGDPRQCTYLTNHSTKNKNRTGLLVLDFFKELEKENLLTIDTMSESYRCSQKICDFANKIYPGLPPMSAIREETLHDGIFYIRDDAVEMYVKKSQPKILRWDKRVNIFGFPASNIGDVKGLTFENVLIMPTLDMIKFLEGGVLNSSKQVSLAKFYVAVTRAKTQVVFIYSGSKDLRIQQLSDV